MASERLFCTMEFNDGTVEIQWLDKANYLETETDEIEDALWLLDNFAIWEWAEEPTYRSDGIVTVKAWKV